MARFYAEIQGNRGAASRMGSKGSGIWSHTRGWGVGVSVKCYVDENGEDCVFVVLTSGSTGDLPEKIIGRFSRADLLKS